MRGAVAAVVLTAMTLALAACAGAAATPTPTPTPTPAGGNPPEPVEALCVSTEAYALELITVVRGVDPLPTAFDAINVGGCDFTRPVVAVRVELLDEDGRVAQTTRIELGEPLTQVGIPLPATVAVPLVDGALAPGRYVRRITALTADGAEAVIAGFEPILVLEARDAPLSNLLRAHARWERSGVQAYDYVIAWNCFCIFGGTPMTVQVREGQVTAVEAVNTLAPPVHEEAPRHTVDGLFAVLAEAYAGDAARVDVEYDEAWGYPASVFIDYHERMADEETGWSISELTLR
jgi:hypothetical protein